MSLSPEARALIEAARDGEDPTADDRDRVRRALLASISGAAVTSGAAASSAAASSAVTAGAAGASGGAAVSAGGAGAAATTGAVVAGGLGGGLAAKLAGAIVVLGLTAGTVALEPWTYAGPSADEFEEAPVVATTDDGVFAEGGTDSADESVEAVTAAEAVPAPAPVADPEPVAGSEPVAVAEAPSAPGPRTAVRRDRDRDRDRPHRTDVSATEAAPVTEPASPPAPEPPASLAAELGLLRAAHAALRAGDPAAAIGHLEAHAHRFPAGALAAERRAARVLALCDLGRAAEARAEADGFLATYPTSPLVPRVRAACR